MADSAIDYVAEITSLTLNPSRLQVKYSPADSADAVRLPVFKNISISSDQFNDSDIQLLIKKNSITAAATWKQAVDVSNANPSFNDSNFVGETYNFRYKPRSYDGTPEYNPLVKKLEIYDSEGPDDIVRKYNIVDMTDSEKGGVYRGLSILKDQLEIALMRQGRLDSTQIAYGVGDPISASWDGSAAGSFDFSTDKVASYGIKTIERVSEGTYRVIPLVPFSNTNYTITTTVGGEDYDSLSSPRQLSVISRAADSFQVHCERTADAADEDNSYMSILIAPFGPSDSAELYYRTSNEFFWPTDSTDTTLSILKDNVLKMNDSDFASWLYSASQ